MKNFLLSSNILRDAPEVGGGGTPGGGTGGAEDGDVKTPESVLFPGEKKEGEGGKSPEGAAGKDGDWKEYVPDPAKSEAENAAAKAEHDKTKPPAKPEWKEYVNDPKKSAEENAKLKAEHDKTKPGDKKDDKTEALDKVPGENEPYQITMPEGVEVDQVLLDKITPRLRAKGYTHREAQELANDFIDVRKQQYADEVKRWGDTVAKWADDAKADKEIGGDKWDASVKDAMRAIATYGTPELKKYLEASGGGNHPEVIRFMAKVGQTVKEDDPPGDRKGGEGKPVEAAHILFPNDAPKG